MKKTVAILLVALITGGAFAADVLVSLGTRENDPNGALAIGATGSGSGGTGIEWVNQDGVSLPLDGAWHQITFTMATDPITGFTGNGILDGVGGTLEHMRFKPNGFNGPITLWFDDIADTIDPPGPVPPQTTTFGTFENDPNGNPYVAGTTVMFREPGFSGSTAAFIDTAQAHTSGVDDTVFHNGTRSLKVEWTWLNDPAAWLRLTTFNTPLQGNPIIRYNNSSVVTMWVRAIPEPSSLLLLGLGAFAALRRR